MPRKEAPRFHDRTRVLKTPDGFRTVKFFKQPTIVPLAEEGDKPVGESGLTGRQIRVLGHRAREQRRPLKQRGIIYGIYGPMED